jgi:isopropylmalate/homocitrate/citramalate synthase
VRVALGCTNEENLESASDSVKAVTAAGKEAMVDCEHFFDGYKANPAYALACAKDRLRGRRALGRAVRHQWRHPARRRCAEIVKP